MSNFKTPFAHADGYKLSHWNQYPRGTEMVYSNFTPRKSRNGQSRFVFFGLQAFIKQLNETFEELFFAWDTPQVIENFKFFYSEYFGADPDDDLLDKLRYLHGLGYLPLEFRALPEGAVVPHDVPCFTIHNTDPNCYWLTNFVESWMSNAIWHTSTSATTAAYYRDAFDRYAEETSDADFMPAFQGHDFSFRGLAGLDAAGASGAAHLLSFQGTDTCLALYWIKDYYSTHGRLNYGTSVPATEHSVMSSTGIEGEFETYRRLITETYPTGIVSIVSDTYDFWRVVTEYLPRLKDEITKREGKLVVRPDSSPKTPVEIICGDPEAPEGSPENLGLARCLYNTFGGTINSKGYIALHPSVGMIYGDSITLEYQEEILRRLKEMGFASTNIVLGIGSYTYQMVTRDTHGIAIKATAVKINGEYRPIFKDPKTDNSGKKSARGLLAVVWNLDDNRYELIDNVSVEEWERAEYTRLFPVWKDGEFIVEWDFEQVRKNLVKSWNGEML